MQTDRWWIERESPEQEEAGCEARMTKDILYLTGTQFEARNANNNPLFERQQHSFYTGRDQLNLQPKKFA